MKFKLSFCLLACALILGSTMSCRKQEKNNENTNNGYENTKDMNADSDSSEQSEDADNDKKTDADSDNKQTNTDEDEEEKPENIFADESIEDFFANSAFVGDSVMHGMELYSKRNKNLESNATFLTLTSFAARHALSDVTETSYHPLYNGEKMKVEDALSLDCANKVFIFLGLNDVRVTPNSYYENYVSFIESIKEKCPDITIFVVSTTFPVEAPHSMDKATAASYRDQLLDLNTRLKEYCDSGAGYYVDVVTPLLNEDGFLDDDYSSDNYVHLTNSAYAKWCEVFENYANSLISTGMPPSDDSETVSDSSQENTSFENKESNENKNM